MKRRKDIKQTRSGSSAVTDIPWKGKMKKKKKKKKEKRKKKSLQKRGVFLFDNQTEF